MIPSAALGLLLALAPAAFAQDDSTAFSDPAVATLILQLRQQQRSNASELAALRKQVADLPAGTAADPDVLKRIAALEKWQAEVDTALAGKASQADLEALAARVQYLEEHPVVVHDTTFEIHASGIHFIAYLGGDAVVAEPIDGAFDHFSGRLVGGARPAWDIGNGGLFALDLEGNWTPNIGEGSGFGVRAVPSLVANAEHADIGLGLGLGYDCSVFLPDQGGCRANHFGALARFTAVTGQTGPGVRFHADVEGNFLDTGNGSGGEVRFIAGADITLGSRRTVSVPTP